MKTVCKIDLHGYTLIDGLNYVIKKYNSINSKKHSAIHVIHGYGASGLGGTIRVHLRLILEKTGIAYAIGENVDGNSGKTIIFISEKKQIYSNLALKISDRVVLQGAEAISETRITNQKVTPVRS